MAPKKSGGRNHLKYYTEQVDVRHSLMAALWCIEVSVMQVFTSPKLSGIPWVTEMDREEAVDFFFKATNISPLLHIRYPRNLDQQYYFTQLLSLLHYAYLNCSPTSRLYCRMFYEHWKEMNICFLFGFQDTLSYAQAYFRLCTIWNYTSAIKFILLPFCYYYFCHSVLKKHFPKNYFLIKHDLELRYM